MAPTPVTFTIEISNDNLREPSSEVLEEIRNTLCALLNRNAQGELVLKTAKGSYDMLEKDPTIEDSFIRRIENTWKVFLGVTMTCGFLLNDYGEDFIYTVPQSDKLFTVNYHMHLPINKQVLAIGVSDDKAYIAQLLIPQDGNFKITFPEYKTDFKHGQKISDLKEDQKTQFKLKWDKNKGQSVRRCISAFANHEGGTLYFGIEDKDYNVCGQECNTEDTRKEIKKCISYLRWPVPNNEINQYWKLEFVSVTNEKYVIVLNVARCPGGVFTEDPESYRVTADGNVEKIPLDTWKPMFHLRYCEVEPCSYCEAIAEYNASVDIDATAAIPGGGNNQQSGEFTGTLETPMDL